MKTVIKQEEVQYTCDLCGKEIKHGLYETDLVEITVHRLKCNSCTEWIDEEVCHCHKDCVRSVIDKIEQNKENEFKEFLKSIGEYKYLE